MTREQIAENLLAWIVDLETTDAKQGTGKLRSIDNEYCCLGRACEVLGVKWHRADGLEWDRYDYIGRDGFSSSSHLCDAELRAFGLTVEEMSRCTLMNDKGGVTFTGIAAWLRENVLPRYVGEVANV